MNLKKIVFFVLLIKCIPMCFSSEYQIVLSRPFTKNYEIGKKSQINYSFGFIVLDNNKKEINKKTQKFSVNYDGIETVKKLDSEGNVLELEVKIQEFLLKSPDGQKVLIPKGKILSAKTAKDRTIYEVDGVELPDNIRQYVSDTISTDKPNEVDPDKLCGTKTKKKIGEKWKVNSELMEKEIDSGIFDVSDVKGTVEFKKIEKVNNIECMVLITRINGRIDHYKTTNTKIIKGNFLWEIISYYPLNTKKHIVKETQKMSTYVECPTPNKEGWITKIDITQALKSESYNLNTKK